MTWGYPVDEEPVLGCSFRVAGQEPPSFIGTLEARRSCLGTIKVSPQCPVCPVAVIIHHKLGGLNNASVSSSSGGQKSEVGFFGLESRCRQPALLPEALGENHPPRLFQLLKAYVPRLMGPASHHTIPASAFIVTSLSLLQGPL